MLYHQKLTLAAQVTHCAPDMPEAPDPTEQGAAQTSANISTATANAALGNVNEYTPQGNVIRKQTGTQEVWDENLKKNITVPTYSVYQTLSAPEQAIYNSSSANKLGANALAGMMIDQVGNVISTPMDYGKLPKAGNAANITAPQYQQFGAGPKYQTSFGNTGPITQGIAGAGNIQNGYNAGGAITRNIQNAGNIQQKYDAGGNIQSVFGNAGDVQGQINNNTKAATTFGQTGSRVQYDIPGANDFSKDRDKYESALMARMNPSLAQDRQKLEQQLVNQGLVAGSDAYNRAIDSSTRQANDARYGAMMNAGQEQQRMFDMASAAGQFHNQANQQDYLQQQGRGTFQQQGQAQNFSQDQARMQAVNAAQGQRYEQLQGRAAFSNQAQSQRNQQNAAAAAFYNQGQDQRYNQYANNAAFQNAAQSQANQQNAALAAFGNQAQQNRWTQNAQQAAFGNAASALRYEQALGRTNLYNQGNQSMYDNAYRQRAGNNALQDQRFNAQQNLFGMQNTQRQNALQEQYDMRSRPINEITALMSGSQVSRPTYAGANMPVLPTVDYAGLMQQQYANQMGQYQAESANTNAMIGGAGSLFGSIIGASDIRLKTNIEPLGVVDGHNAYAFDYRDPADGVGRHIGVMAQEVMQTRPDAVLRRADGMLMVDYGALFGDRQHG